MVEHDLSGRRQQRRRRRHLCGPPQPLTARQRHRCRPPPSPVSTGLPGFRWGAR
jgi:hypothetical protein